MAGMMGWRMAEEGWRKGPWTPAEDKLLMDYVALHGEGRWSSVAGFSGLRRNGKSCRLRWVNYLRPGLKKGHLSPQEEGIIIELHSLWGNKWSTIARYLPGRTDNEIKNYWRTHFKTKEKPLHNEKKNNEKKRKREFEAESSHNDKEHKVIRSINDKTSLESNQNDRGMIIEPPHSTMQDTSHALICPVITNDQQQNPCVLAEDVARWWDTVSEDRLWSSGFLWNQMDHGYPTQAVVEQSMSSCF